MMDYELLDNLYRKDVIDFLLLKGYDRKKILRLSDDSLITAYDIAKRGKTTQRTTIRKKGSPQKRHTRTSKKGKFFQAGRGVAKYYKPSFGKKRKFKVGDIVEIYPNYPEFKGKGKIVEYQPNTGYIIKAISGSPHKEFGGKKKLTYYDSELKKVKT